MTRLERMAKEAVHWAPVWGAQWAVDYMFAALLADHLERKKALEEKEGK